jgi:hypothetical protein
MHEHDNWHVKVFWRCAVLLEGDKSCTRKLPDVHPWCLHQRPIGPLQLLFLRRRPAGRPFHSFRFRCALPSAHTATDYTVSFPLMNHFLPPSSAIRTLVFIGGSCGLLLQGACMGGGTRTTGEPLLGGGPTWFWDYFLYQSCSLAIASTVEDECGSLSRGTLFVPPRLSSLSPSCPLHIATTRSAVRSHFRLSSVTGFK